MESVQALSGGGDSTGMVRVRVEERDLHVVADASFPDRQGLGLREQPSAGLGQLLAGCQAKERPRLAGSLGPGRPLPTPLGAPASGPLGACCPPTFGLRPEFS